MTILTFTITFHSPFRVGAAYARDGVDAAVDTSDALPADHLKGVMRAAADEIFGQRNHWAVNEVFGSPAAPSPWTWSSAEPLGTVAQKDGGWKVSERHRVTIDAETHSAKKVHLVLGEQAWAERAQFTVSRAGSFPPGHGLDETDHARILRCAAAGVHGLGAWRRRGLGWVGLNADVTADDVAAILAIRQREAAGR